MSNHDTGGEERWRFGIDDVIETSGERTKLAVEKNYRVTRRLTDEEGQRFYHLAVMVPSPVGDDDAKVYEEVLVEAETVEREYRHVSGERDHDEGEE